jgi:5'-nucleotidase/UDP-sugar diphosphatase
MKLRLILLLAIISLLASCSNAEKKRITLFYTADEHGWFNDNEKADGAAAMMYLWKEKENYSLEADSFLVISGGDNWTGSSVSTWFKGQSMFKVMQALGYDVAALGNHEFDFTLDTLKARAKASSFPYVAANIKNKKGETPCFMKPWKIVEANGLKVGLLGLSNLETPNTTNPTAVKNLTFTPYAEAIKHYVPELKAQGAQVIIIVGHICKEEMQALTPLAASYGIPLITGGHCHQQVLEKKDEVLMIESQAYLQSYVKVVIEYDPINETSKAISYEVIPNISEQKDVEIEAIIKAWEQKADKSLKDIVGYTQNTISKNSEMMHDLLMKSWMNSFAHTDIAITNTGGIRQDIEAGNITMADILGLLPFNNELVKLNVSGKDLNAFIQRIPTMKETYVWGGMSAESHFDNDKHYTLLTTDFLYALEETQFKVYDPKPYLSGMLYRAPVIQWLRTLKTGKENPLEGYLK